MKKHLLTIMLLVSSLCFAGKIDSTFQRHQLSFSLTNAMSGQFLDGRHGLCTKIVENHFGLGGSTNKFLPNYSVRLNFNYNLGLSSHFRLETGVGYLLAGQTSVNEYPSEAVLYQYKEFYYLGQFTLPLYMKYIKKTTKGAFTTTFGPCFYIPINFLDHRFDFNVASDAIATHGAFDSGNISYLSTMGLDLKLGYEKKIQHNLSITVGPFISFSNLILLDRNLGNQYTESYYRPYQYYIGLDVAVNLCLKK